MIFDQPTSISMIKIWNYSKNFNRGAKDFAVSTVVLGGKYYEVLLGILIMSLSIYGHHFDR